MHLTGPEAGAIMLALFAVFYYLQIFAVVTAVIGLVGVVLTGTQGWIGRVITDVAGWATHLTGTVVSNLVGFSAAGLLTIIIGTVYIHDLHPKNPTGKRTAWIGVALGALIVGGLTGIPALAGLHTAITSAVTNALSLL
jgi:hypothetical protein